MLNLVDSAGKYYIADGEPAITSVTASVTGALVADDDYTIIVLDNSKSGYGIILNTDGTKAVDTDEDIVIVFNSPVVKASTTLSAGGNKNPNPIEGFLETTTRDGSVVKTYFHKGYFSGNYSIPSGSVNSPEAATTDVTITLFADTTFPVGQTVFYQEIV